MRDARYGLARHSHAGAYVLQTLDPTDPTKYQTATTGYISTVTDQYVDDGLGTNRPVASPTTRIVGRYGYEHWLGVRNPVTEQYDALAVGSAATTPAAIDAVISVPLSYQAKTVSVATYTAEPGYTAWDTVETTPELQWRVSWDGLVLFSTTGSDPIAQSISSTGCSTCEGALGNLYSFYGGDSYGSVSGCSWNGYVPNRNVDCYPTYYCYSTYISGDTTLGASTFLYDHSSANLKERSTVTAVTAQLPPVYADGATVPFKSDLPTLGEPAVVDHPIAFKDSSWQPHAGWLNNGPRSYRPVKLHSFSRTMYSNRYGTTTTGYTPARSSRH
jgi:hypothetical protein